MKAYSTFLFITLLTLGSTLNAKEYVWLIGGGPELDNSQAQIELNTIWLTQLLAKHKSGAKTKLYFTDGNNPNSDVKIQIANKEDKDSLQILARVFNQHQANITHYYNSQLNQVYGPTNSDFVRSDLAKDFGQLHSGDKLLFIFQGHGDIDKSDTANNSFKLWGDTRFSVKQLERLLSQIQADVEVRYFFPQCFSGGFHKLIYQQTEAKLGLSKQLRCGFMAEADYEESEGCTSSINEKDYRDYSTYFFAAIDGQKRTGESLLANPDSDNDGKVSLREAHFYSISEAQSADIPRATSETFLEQWQPWYFRWQTTASLPNNEYAQLAKSIAKNNRLSLNSAGQVLQLEAHLQSLGKKRQELEQRYGELAKQITDLQNKLSAQVISKWPNIQFPNTQKYVQLLQQQSHKIQDYIASQDDYLSLAQAQDEQVSIDKKLLNIRRQLTQIQKVNRFTHLARLLQLFKSTANQQDLQSYKRLVQCESSPF